MLVHRSGANRSKTRLTPGRGVAASSLPAGLEVDPCAVVLRHGHGTPVPALPANSHADGSQLAPGSAEVRSIQANRVSFYTRLADLQRAGLKTQAAMDLLRVRTAGDYVFVARACGIPASDARALDASLLSAVRQFLIFGSAEGGQIADQKFFLRSEDGGMGFQSIGRTSPAAYAASWHACLPKILQRLNLPGTGALSAVSPWTAICLPVASVALREAVGDDSLNIGDDGVTASQHLLAKASHAAAVKLISEEVAGDIKASAALLSAAGTGAGLWTKAASLPNQHLSDIQFRVASRTRLHMPIPGCVGLCQHRRRDGTLCGAPLDPHGYHARICPCGGWVMKRHDAACAVIASWCEEMGCQLEAGQKP